MKLTEVLVYVGVYFTARSSCSPSSDWRLPCRSLIWLGGYIVVLRYFVPRLGSCRRSRPTRARW